MAKTIDLSRIPDEVLFAEAAKRHETLTEQRGKWAVLKKPRKCKACGRDCPTTRDWRSHECPNSRHWFITENGKRVIVR